MTGDLNVKRRAHHDACCAEPEPTRMQPLTNQNLRLGILPAYTGHAIAALGRVKGVGHGAKIGILAFVQPIREFLFRRLNDRLLRSIILIAISTPKIILAISNVELIVGREFMNLNFLLETITSFDLYVLCSILY